MTAWMPGPALPDGLRERVLAASRLARPAGTGVPDVTPDSPLDAFGYAVSAFHHTLAGLSDAGWHTPVLRDLDVQGLVGHLIGVEGDVQRAIAGDPAVASTEHVSATQPAALAQAGRPAGDTMADWRATADRTLALADRTSGDLGVVLYGVPLPVRDLLVARAFELWTHENDIRAAIGLPPSVPRPSTLRPMTELATALLPFGAAVSGLTEPISLHLVLTGPGGGTWDIGVGQPSANPAALTIVTGVVGFCRLFSNRVDPAELDVSITGERRQAETVLAAAAALSLD